MNSVVTTEVRDRFFCPTLEDFCVSLFLRLKTLLLRCSSDHCIFVFKCKSPRAAFNSRGTQLAKFLDYLEV